MSEDSIVLVAGARPNFVKIAPILRRLREPGAPPVELVHTGQHYDFEMSGVFFEQLGIPQPDAHLHVGSGAHAVQTGRVMIAFDEWLAARTRPPAAVIVVGDVNSTMACALVAVKRGIYTVHVESGLRSFDRAMPEEINRVVTDSVADLLLVSEPAGLENLEKEGIARSRIAYVGNVMIDTLVHQLPAARELRVYQRWNLEPKNYAVVTMHRPSNVDSPDQLGAIASLLGKLAAEIPVVFPAHPRTEKRLQELGLLRELEGVRISAPLGYREFLSLVASARVVVTDSGGIQEETSYLGVPCVTVRTSTERPVTVSCGTNVLVGDSPEAALAAARDILRNGGKSGTPIDGWDGHAAVRIVDEIVRRLGPR